MKLLIISVLIAVVMAGGGGSAKASGWDGKKRCKGKEWKDEQICNAQASAYACGKSKLCNLLPEAQVGSQYWKKAAQAAEAQVGSQYWKKAAQAAEDQVGSQYWKKAAQAAEAQVGSQYWKKAAQAAEDQVGSQYWKKAAQAAEAQVGSQYWKKAAQAASLEDTSAIFVHSPVERKHAFVINALAAVGFGAMVYLAYKGGKSIMA